MIQGYGRCAAVGIRSAVKNTVLPPPVSRTHIMSRLWPGTRMSSTPGITSVSPSSNRHCPDFSIGGVVFREIARAVAIAGILGVFEFSLLHEILRVGEDGHGLTVHDARVPPAVIEMKMGIDYDIDFFWGNTARDEFFRKPRGGVERINLRAFCVPLFSCAGLYQDPLPCRANQQRIHRHEDAIAGVGGRNALPHGLGDHAKHRAAIQAECSVGDQPEFEIAEFHPLFLERPARESNSCTAAYGSFFRSATSRDKASSAASPCAPEIARSRNNSFARVMRRRFQRSTLLDSRSALLSKCLRYSAIAATRASTPLFSVAIVRTIFGFQPLRSGPSSSIAASWVSKFSTPSRSDLFRTKMSAISIRPAFIFCTSSPIPGTRSTSVQSARRTISTSSWPTPTVSTSTCCFPAASRIRATSPVARAKIGR